MSPSESFRPAPVTKWALDELEMPDIFEGPLNRDLAARPEAGTAHARGEQAITAHQELARTEAAAYAHGQADGEKLAWAELLPRVEFIAQALGAALADVRLHQARWTANAEENLAVLAVAVARQLIAREVETDATIVSGLVQRALAQFPLDQQVTVRLHPDDANSCIELLQPSEGNKFHEIRWATDTQVHRGGCMVEGRERIIDGRIDTALERIYQSIGNVQAS